MKVKTLTLKTMLTVQIRHTLVVTKFDAVISEVQISQPNYSQ